MMKNCSRCGVEHPLSAFNVNRRNASGLESACRDSIAQARAARTLRNRELPCDYGDCKRPRTGTSKWCGAHFRRRYNGTPMDAPVKIDREWGDWQVSADGYVRRQKTRNGRHYRQLQHRVVMEEHLGRKLLPSETVHHRNGVRHDNRIDNLELWNTHQPKGQRVEDLLAWAREIIRMYEGVEVKLVEEIEEEMVL